MRWGLAALASLATLLIDAMLVQAAPYVVTDTADLARAPGFFGQCVSVVGTCTLRAAVKAAGETGEPVSLQAPGPYVLTQGPLITDNTLVSITNASGGVVAIDGNHADRVFKTLGPGGDLALDGVTVQNGVASGSDGGGGGILSQSNLTLTNVTLSGNSAIQGGAIFTNPGRSTTLTNVTLTGNTATIGGAIYNNDNNPPNGPVMTLVNVTLSGNSAESAAGSFFNGGITTLTNATFSGNTTRAAGGGAIYNASWAVSVQPPLSKGRPASLPRRPRGATTAA